MFCVQLCHVGLRNVEVVCSECSFVMLGFVMWSQCVLCAALSCWASQCGGSVFCVQLFHVGLRNVEVVSSECSFVMLGFVMWRQCVLCAAFSCWAS